MEYTMNTDFKVIRQRLNKLEKKLKVPTNGTGLLYINHDSGKWCLAGTNKSFITSSAAINHFSKSHDEAAVLIIDDI